MSNHEKKQKKSIVLIALLLLLLLAVCAAGIYFFTPWFGGNEPTEPTETVPLDTSVPDETDEEVILYYNVDREQYAGKGEDGLTSRQKDPDTGYYHITFAAKGRVAARRVIDRRIATKIDNQEVMSLVLDESGIVTDLITVDECTGGYWMLGKHTFVSAADGYTLTLYGNEDMQGSTYTLEYTAETKVYDVSALAAENGTQGQESIIQEGDELLVILNKDGSVGWIYVVDRVRPVVTRTHWCDHCQKEVTWIEWEKEDSLPISGEGHYYLAYDVTLPKQASMEKDATIILDLNGHLVTGKKGNRVYSLHNEGTYLAIMDYSEAQTGVIRPAATTKASDTTNQGGCVWLRYGEFELFGGTLDASGYAGNTFGMAVQVSKNTTFKMHGGTLIGGTSVAVYNTEKKAYQQGYGGAVSVSGTFEMNGGTITGGRAEPLYVNGNSKQGAGGNVYLAGGSTFTMNGGVIKNGWTISGGNVYVAGNATFNMNGGVIRDGSAVNSAGNLMIGSKASANISGGEIVNGEITGKGKNGGSIYVTSNSTLNMYGGWVYGGTARNCGGNMVVYGTFNMYGGNISNGRILDYETGKEKVSTSANIFVVNSTMNMYGGEVNGHLQLINTTGKEFKMLISGTAKVTKSKDGAPSLYIPSGKTIEVGELKDGAEIYVTASGFFSGETLEKNKNYIHSDIDGVETGYSDKRLFFGRMQCLCGASVNGGEHIGDCDGTLHAFTAWTSTTSLPTTEGCYYLTSDVKMSGQAQIKTDATVALDLNGHSVTGKSGVRVYALWKDCKANLYIADSSKEQSGRITIAGSGTNQGSLFWFYGTDHTLTIYGGTYSAEAVTLTGNSGAAINSAASGTVINMYGGRILGGQAMVNEKFSGGGGGTVYLKNGTFNMYGGEIIGGSAQTGGGNVYVDSKATFNMYGGTVSHGTASLYRNAEDKDVNALGGNIFIAGSNATVNLYGGTVSDGYAAGNGGNVKVTKGGVLNISGGVIENGTTKDSGGNIVLYGTMTMTGGEINGGKKVGTSENGITNIQSNVFVVNGKVDMSGGTIDGHMSLYGTHEINLSGTAKIKASDGGTSLNVPVNNKINVGKMADGAEVYVTATGIFTTETDEANEKYFHSDDAAQSVAYYQNCLATGRMQCICGASVNGGEHIGDCDGELHLFTAWTSSNSLPNTTGNYYLTKNVTLTAQTQVKTDATIALDLNGYTVKGKDGLRVYALWKDCKATLSITDSFKEKSGAITIGGSGTNQGMLVWFYGTNHTLNLYGGTFDASAATLTGNSGTAINAGANGSTVNMYGGTLIGGKAAANEKGSGGMGGAVYVGSGATFNMTGGWIYGGTATGNGGNVYVDGKMTLGKNAVISNGTANGGGNILVGGKATLTTDGGELIGGIASGNGGNIDVLNGGKLNLKNTLLSSGSATRGGNLAVFGTAVLTGGKLEATAVNVDSYNLFIYNSGNVTLDGTEVMTSASDKYDGDKYGISLSGEKGKNPKLTIKGDTVITESAIVLQDKANPVLNIEGGTFTTSMSDAILLKATGTSTLTMSGGTITSTAANAISLTGASSSFTMTGGEISSTGLNAINLTGANASFTLNGGKITSKNQNAVYLGGEKASFTMNGGEINTSLNNAVCTEGKNATFTMTDGTITSTSLNAINLRGSDGVTPKMTMTGGTIDSSNGERTIIIQKGSATISGGTVKGGTTANDGGSIYVSSGATLELSGDAVVTGGSAANGGNIYVADNATFTMNGGTVSDGYCTSNGGNIYLKANAKFYMNGGSVLNGEAKNQGGNFWNFGTIIMTGGKISGGKVTGKPANTGANINMTATSGSVSVFTMSGGEIDGDVGLGQYNTTKTPTVTISGTAKIKATDGGTSLYIPSGFKINVGTMADGAEVYVTATGIFSETTDEANAKYFHSDDASEAVVHYDGCLAIGRMQCVCGVSLTGDSHADHIGDCDGTLHAFCEWTSTTTLPTKAGYYYLTNNVTTGQNNISTAVNVVLDLNGKTVTNNSGRVYALWDTAGATLTIADSSAGKTGTMVTKASGSNQGGIVWFKGQNHTLNLYGGTFDASGVTDYTTGGAAINTTASGSTINMYGGTIIGGTTTGSGAAVYLGNKDATTNIVFNMSGNAKIVGGSAKNGGAVFLNPKVTMTMSDNATLTGGTATTGIGGNIYIEKDSSLTLKGNATIENGTASAGNGGNIYVTGALTVENGTITGGSAKNGANIYAAGTLTVKGGTISGDTTVGSNGIMTMTGGKIVATKENAVYLVGSKAEFTMSGGEISTSANNAVCVEGANAKFKMTDGTITSTSTNTINLRSGSAPQMTMTGGTIDCTNGQRAIIVQKGSATISGGTVKGGTTTGDAYGGSIYVNSGAKLTLNGNALVTGGKSAIGGNIYACADATVEIGGDAKITDGTATSYKKSDETVGGIGGNIYAKSFTMTGGTISGGMANVNGGNVYAYGTVTLSGGTISNGTATGNGGNIYASNGQFSLTGGTISGGKAARGGNVEVAKGTFTLDGGTITGGKANTTHGGNVYLCYGATFELKSGTVENGTAATKGQGGNFYVRGALKMSGGKITTTGTSGNSNLQITSTTNDKPSFEMSGGEINGMVSVGAYQTTNLPTVTLSGNAKIINEAGTSGVSLSSGTTSATATTRVYPLITIEDGFTGEVFVATAEDGYKITKSANTFESNIKCADGWFINYETDGYVLYNGANHRMQYICGASLSGGDHAAHGTCDGKLHLFDAWTKTDSLPTATGYYYLTKDVNMTAAATLRINGDLVLDLNGHTVNGNSGSRIYAVWATKSGETTTYSANLTISDSVGTGTMKVTGNGDQGRVIWLNGKHSLTIYGGTLDASAATANKVDGKTKNGVAIAAETAGSVVNMYGGKIVGGDAATNGCNGGAVQIGGTNTKFNMYGGTITGGSAANGGAVYVGSGATFAISGDAKIEGGNATNGGTVYVGEGATFTMSGNATVIDGEATKGGNIYAVGGSTLTVAGNAKIMDGTATSEGGNIFAKKLVMTGGTISGGKAGSIGGNAYIWDESEISNAKIENGTSTGSAGGNLNVSGKITMTDTAVSGGSANTNGGNIYIGSGSTATLTNVQITSGTAQRGNNLGVWGTATVTGGKIESTETTATGDGYNIFVYNNGNLTVDGTEIIGANVEKNAIAMYREKTAVAKLEIKGNTKITNSIVNVGANTQATLTDGTISGSTIKVNGTLTMNGGTVTDGSAANGGAVVVNNGATFNMNGGTIKDGTATDNGGNIYVDGGTVTVTDGTISGGSATGNGGNIYVTKGTFTLNGGTITGGKTTGAGKNGGSIFVSSGTTFTMNGGTITGGSATNLGGNVYVNGTLNMTDGEIKGGMSNSTETDTNSSNIFIVNGTLNMSGGTIDGHVAVTPTKADSCTLKLSGSAKLISSDGTSGITLGKSGDYVTSVELGDDFTGKVLLNPNAYTEARVVATSTNGTFSVNENIVLGNTAYFAFYESGEYKLYSSASYRTQYICGASLSGGNHDAHGTCDGTLHLFTAWTSTTTLPTTAGYYYLTKDVNPTAQANVNTNANIVLDLNGKTVTGASGIRLYSLGTTGGATLTISDSVGNGKMLTYAKSVSGNPCQGGIIWFRGNNHTLNIYGGTFDASGVTDYTASGAAINATASGSTINMYGGTIIGGTTTGSGAAVYLGNKDATTNIVFNMSGNAKIVGGSAKNGGAVFLNPKVTMTMSDNATLTGGTATSGIGGNIYIEKDSSLTLKGNATIENGTASAGNGGNIYVTGALTVENGTITGGSAKNGGNIYVNGTLTVENGTITGGKATTGNGGNIYLAKSAQFTMENGTVTGGETQNTADMPLGGNVYVGESATFNMNGGTVSNGKTVGNGRGGNIALGAANATMTMKGEATVTGGSSEKFGGNIYLHAATNVKLTMNGGTISDGNANSYGGNVYIHELATLNMERGNSDRDFGTISGGNSGTDGGNVFGYGTLNMTAGVITEGKVNGNGAHNSANVCMTTNTDYDSAFTMTGGQIGGYVELRAGSKTLTSTVGGDALIRNLALNSGVMLTPNTSYSPYITINENYSGCLVVAVNKTEPSGYVIVKSTDRHLTYGDYPKLVVGNAGYKATFTALATAGEAGTYTLTAE